MVNPGRPIPRRTLVPLHVRIKNEQLSVRVKCQPIGIPEATSNHLPPVAVAVGANDVPGRCYDPLVKQDAIPVAGQQLILCIIAVGRLRARGKILGQEHIVPVRKIDETVGAKRDRVASMTDCATGFFEECHLIELIIPGRISEPIKALRIVGVRVEAVVRPKQSAALV